MPLDSGGSLKPRSSKKKGEKGVRPTVVLFFADIYADNEMLF